MRHPQQICAANSIHILRPQWLQLRRTIAHHFAHRHDGRGSKAVRNWIKELRGFEAASGYSKIVARLPKD